MATSPERFRLIALGQPESVEAAHQGHPDFRVAGKVFATLGYPDPAWAMVKLTPEEQTLLVEAEPDVFVPAKGSWGRGGCTMLRLGAASDEAVRDAVQRAWRRAASKRLAAASAR